MFDINLIRQDKDSVKKRLETKRSQVDLDSIIGEDQARRELQAKLDDLRSQQNIANDEIGKELKEKKDPFQKIAAMKSISDQISILEPELKVRQTNVYEQLISIPNLPHESVPVGGIDQNKVVRSWGEKRLFDFKPRTHIEIVERLDIVDFKRATKISGSNFLLFKKAGAQLQRALIQFMLDIHTRSHGFTEVHPPVLVNRASMTGTGQLPKMEEDMYRLKEEDMFLIPTAEVPVTNIHRDEILKQEDLPIYYTAYTACFRREAGSYGKETKGMIRVHQFDKVELVKFVEPQYSYDELESLVSCAEKVFQLLKLPYRVVLLATGDLSFAAAKCYDIEVYAHGLDHWLEASSCSNFEDFQARRANIRYKSAQGNKPTYVHTLNGSGVALPRTMIALLEHYQTKEGDVVIPEVLQSYMGGMTKIDCSRT